MRTRKQINLLIEQKTALVRDKIAQAKSIETDEAQAEAYSATVGEITALNSEIETLEEEAKTAPDLDGIETKNAERHQNATQIVSRPAMPSGTATSNAGEFKVSGNLPAQVSRARDADITSFKSGTREERAFKAYGFGQWFIASQFGVKSAVDFCQKNNIALREVKAGAEGVNSLGGALVPIQFDNDLIDLREEFGVFRRNAKISQMTSDTKVVPRRTGGLTAYWGAENAQMTDSDKTWDDVELVARKLYALAKYSAEYSEDAIISVGNDLAQEIAYAFSIAEDAAGFNGDGTGAYGRITGVRTKLLSIYTATGGVGLKLASGNQWSEITLNDFHGMTAILPMYARRGNVKWYAHQAFYSNVMQRLAFAAGGVTAAEIAAGMKEPRFMGFPVEITQTLPAVEANSQIPVLFGDLAAAALFGDRRSTTIAVSEHANFEKEQWTIRGSERLDINVHDVGTTLAAGPMVGLITAAS